MKGFAQAAKKLGFKLSKDEADGTLILGDKPVRTEDGKGIPVIIEQGSGVCDYMVGVIDSDYSGYLYLSEEFTSKKGLESAVKKMVRDLHCDNPFEVLFSED